MNFNTNNKHMLPPSSKCDSAASSTSAHFIFADANASRTFGIAAATFVYISRLLRWIFHLVCRWVLVLGKAQVLMYNHFRFYILWTVHFRSAHIYQNVWLNDACWCWLVWSMKLNDLWIWLRSEDKFMERMFAISLDVLTKMNALNLSVAHREPLQSCHIILIPSKMIFVV